MSGDGINQGETTDTTNQDEENDEISTNDEKSVTEDSDTSEDSSESTERHSSNTNIDEEQPLIYLDDDTLKLNEHIEDRIRNLQKTMLCLKEELVAEKEAWVKDVEELAQAQDTCECGSLLRGGISDSDVCLSSEPTVSDSLLNFEQKLNEYQRTLQTSQNEKRYQIRRQIAADAYKRRLLEVENMCNMELLRVKQSVQFLQPLQQIAAEWEFRHSDAGDAQHWNLLQNTSSASLNDDLFKKKVSSDLSFPTMECIGSQYFEMSRKAGVYNSNFGKNMNAPLESGEKFVKESTETVSVTESKSAVWTGEIQGENSSLSPTAISLP